jgi:hypothetical protein
MRRCSPAAAAVAGRTLRVRVALHQHSAIRNSRFSLSFVICHKGEAR